MTSGGPDGDCAVATTVRMESEEERLKSSHREGSSKETGAEIGADRAPRRQMLPRVYEGRGRTKTKGGRRRACPRFREGTASATKDQVLIVSSSVMWNWPFGGGGLLVGADDHALVVDRESGREAAGTERDRDLEVAAVPVGEVGRIRRLQGAGAVRDDGVRGRA